MASGSRRTVSEGMGDAAEAVRWLRAGACAVYKVHSSFVLLCCYHLMFGRKGGCGGLWLDFGPQWGIIENSISRQSLLWRKLKEVLFL